MPHRHQFMRKAATIPARAELKFGQSIHSYKQNFMSLIVQKYGGTSMGTPERIRNVARRVLRWKAKGHQIVVVVSAKASAGRIAGTMSDKYISVVRRATSFCL